MSIALHSASSRLPVELGSRERRASISGYPLRAWPVMSKKRVYRTRVVNDHDNLYGPIFFLWSISL